MVTPRLIPGVLGAVLVENGAIGVAGGLLAMLLVAAVARLLGQAIYSQPFSIPLPLALAAIPLTAAACMAVAGTVPGARRACGRSTCRATNK